MLNRSQDPSAIDPQEMVAAPDDLPGKGTPPRQIQPYAVVCHISSN
ncbi:MAG: hypothetical protein OSB12_06685 [Planctomycetota bacterium]|nr:hypothetical protein [Planctomycetota bacterium]